MKKIEEKVIKTIAKHEMISRGDRILISLSGGPDSVFLLYFLNKFKKKYNCELGAFHLNHKLRGKDADEDEIFCSELCSRLNIPLYKVRKNIRSISQKRKISLEEAGRDTRYAELKKIAVKEGYTKIATAHNAGDTSETILLNLIKGTGLKGLSGIPFKRQNIIRPILSVKKDEILSYLSVNKVDFRKDKTNDLPDFERNFIRINVIPLIKERLNPSLEETLLSTSQILGDINTFLDKIVDKEIIHLKKEKDNFRIPINSITGFHSELRGLLIKTLLERNFLVTITFNDINALLELVYSQPGKSVHISGGILCFRDRDTLLVSKKEEIPPVELSIKPGETIKVDGAEVSINYTNSSHFSGDKSREFISADNLPEETFVLRNWRPGDKFFPIGMKGSKNISDFLNNLKKEPSQKKKQLVLLNKNKIIWVVGERLDNRFRITPKTNKILELCLKKN